LQAKRDAVYRTLPDTFVRVIGHYPPGREGTESAISFEAQLPSGLVIEYGTDDSSKPQAPGGVPRAWLAAKARRGAQRDLGRGGHRAPQARRHPYQGGQPLEALQELGGQGLPHAGDQRVRRDARLIHRRGYGLHAPVTAGPLAPPVSAERAPRDALPREHEPRRQKPERRCRPHDTRAARHEKLRDHPGVRRGANRRRGRPRPSQPSGSRAVIGASAPTRSATG